MASLYVTSVKRLFKEPKEKSKPMFTFSDVVHGNGNCASQLKISESQAFLKVISTITKLKKLKNTNTANLIHQGL